MDRSKGSGSSGPPRGPKSKITQQPPDLFIALGAKQGSPRDDPKRTLPLPGKPSASGLGSIKVPEKLKREASSTSLPSVPSSKKLKTMTVPSRGNTPGVLTHGSLSVEPWESLAFDCDATDLPEMVMSAMNAGLMEKAVGCVLGVLRTVRMQRFKMCRVIYSSLMFTSACCPTLFTNEQIILALVGMLRREASMGFKTANKTNNQFHLLINNILYRAFVDVPNWPEIFVRLYIDDAIADRIFIDNPYCKPFIDNILTAFCTKLPPSSLLKSEIWSSTSRDTSSPLTITSIDDDSKNEALNEHKMLVDSWVSKVYPRYTQTQELVEKITVEVIKEQLARRQQPETITKNFVRFLSVACGLVEIRVIAVSRIEGWLHNHKLMKPAQELLAYLCYNCSANSQRDLEIIAQLSKLRLKNKPMVNFFNNCMREMVYSFPENLYPLLKYTIYNELSNARNNNNLIVVGALFQVAPEPCADSFADICLELLLNKDDYLRSLRTLLKEINRVLRNDFNLVSIVHALLRERKEYSNTIRDSEFRERILMALTDLVCMCQFLCVTPSVRDAASQGKRDSQVMRQFCKAINNIQRECVAWLQDANTMRTFRPSVADFHYVLLRVTMLEPIEQYCKVDSWPGENERNLYYRLISEVSLQAAATLIRILLMGVCKEHPLSANEALDATEQMVRRAAHLQPEGCFHPIHCDTLDIFQLYFSLCSYNYPENITLPIGYVPPQLAIGMLYWRAWLVLLIVAAHNPVTIGNEAWHKYPTLRMFMEMCVTNHFTFPPPTMVTVDDDYQSREQQILVMERQKIIEFETHLASTEITEQSSLLLPQLIELKPEAEPRRPPQQVLDQLKILNTTYHLGHLLCRSRSPDFLLDIMSRQGGAAHMPWLAELVHSSEGALAHLPVQCLCEYLLSTTPTEKLTKHAQLLTHLRQVVNYYELAGGATAKSSVIIQNDAQIACEVLEYLFRRLTSEFSASRTQATKALNLILAPNANINSDDTITPISGEDSSLWLTKYIANFAHLNIIKPILVQFLRQAVQIETNPERVSSYINFLAVQSNAEDSFADLHELVTDLSSVIIERHSVTSYILPGQQSDTLINLLRTFYQYCQLVRKLCTNEAEVAGVNSVVQNYGGECVLVLWPNGDQCTMQIIVIHAIIVLLTYGHTSSIKPGMENTTHASLHAALLRMWFPVSIAERPRAYNPADPTEYVSFLPDWIKLRMIRSSVDRLVDVAIERLEPSKLVLFIQSFGIPVSSICKLLYALDVATKMDPKLVVEAVLDKTYMIQLVKVQNRRGARGGEVFVKAIEGGHQLRDDEHLHVELEPMMKKIPRQWLITHSSGSGVRGDVQEHSNPNTIEHLLIHIFTINLDDTRTHSVGKLVEILSQRQNISLYTNVQQFLLQCNIQNVVHTVLNILSVSVLFKLVLSKPWLNEQTKCNFITTMLCNLTPINKNNPTYVILRHYSGQQRRKKEVNVSARAPMPSSTTLLLGDAISMKAEKYTISMEQLNKAMTKDNAAQHMGVLVDWLGKEELQIDSNERMELLFSRIQLPFRPLLMSLALQRSSWQNLYNMMKYLMIEANRKQICPTSALEFLSALKKQPKLWQGRDKAVPKHFKPDDIFNLSRDQALKLLAYIIDEAQQNYVVTKDEQKIDWRQKMEFRLHALLTCLEPNSCELIEELSKRDDNVSNDIRQELLLMIYMSIPSSGQNVVNKLLKERFQYQTDCTLLSSTSYMRNYSNAADQIAHCLLSALTNINSGNIRGTAAKDWIKRSQELEACTRKLATTHPILVLRQLAMIAGGLKGRAQYEWGIMRSRGHFLLFTQILGLIELLEPLIFDHSNILCNLMDSYFLLIQCHGHVKEMNSCTRRVMIFIQNWLLNDIKKASKYLQSQAHVLEDMQTAQPCIRPLLASISSLPLSEQIEPIIDRSTINTNQLMDPMPPQWKSLFEALNVAVKKPPFDDAALLQDLEHATNKRPHLLKAMSHHLLNMLNQSPNSAVRSQALSLVIRWLKHEPRDAKDTLPVLLQCLNSDNGAVVENVLDRLPELISVMQEYGKMLLMEAFDMGTHSKRNTLTQITKCINALNLQRGC